VYPGSLTPVGGDNPPVDPASTLFDMASITKIVGGTTASAILYQAGLLDLDALVADASLLGPAYASGGKGGVRVRDCLLHQAGYPPDPSPAYSDAAFGCPATALQTPPLTFNCSELVFASLLAQPLQYPTGTQWLYSDLSLITVQYVVGTIVAANGLVPADALLPACASADPLASPGLYKTCYFEAFVRTQVLAPARMTGAGFLPSPAAWADCMPTFNETAYYRHAVVQGTVSDDNAYALGGVAGHAGVFASLDSMAQFVGTWAGLPGYGPPGGLVNATTREAFWTPPAPAFSPRALGWLVQVPTDTYLGCGNFSASTVYHTGYTGAWQDSPGAPAKALPPPLPQPSHSIFQTAANLQAH